MKIGILALQGSVIEHRRMLEKLDIDVVEVRLPKDLDNIDGLIIPGGESTTISLLMEKYELDKKIVKRHREGMPVYGTCAGAILLAKEIVGEDKKSPLGLMDIAIKRNDYGRQIDSFEADLSIANIGDFKGVFIRAPVLKRFFNGVRILSEHNNNVVMAQQGNLLITTFHPELTDDPRVHKYFVGMINNK